MNISEALKKRGQLVLQNLFDEVKNGKQASINEVEKYIDALIEEVTHQREGELLLLQTDSAELYTLYHSLNVTFLSLIMAFKTGVGGLELKEIGMGAILHDIGKINVPYDIQWKQHGDNEYEQTSLAEHPVFGAHWMSRSAIISDEVLQIIEKHHEAFNGKGYPHGVSTRELPRAVHIVSICNYYDFHVNSIDENISVDPRSACFIITKESGKMFSPQIVGNFITYMGPMLMDGPLYQKTALVLLDTREVAAVSNTTGFGDTLPEILILTNREGKKLQRPVSVNLKKDGSRHIVKLLRS